MALGNSMAWPTSRILPLLKTIGPCCWEHSIDNRKTNPLKMYPLCINSGDSSFVIVIFSGFFDLKSSGFSDILTGHDTVNTNESCISGTRRWEGQRTVPRKAEFGSVFFRCKVSKTWKVPRQEMCVLWDFYGIDNDRCISRFFEYTL